MKFGHNIPGFMKLIFNPCRVPANPAQHETNG